MPPVRFVGRKGGGGRKIKETRVRPIHCFAVFNVTCLSDVTHVTCSWKKLYFEHNLFSGRWAIRIFILSKKS